MVRSLHFHLIYLTYTEEKRCRFFPSGIVDRHCTVCSRCLWQWVGHTLTLYHASEELSCSPSRLLVVTPDTESNHPSELSRLTPSFWLYLRIESLEGSRSRDPQNLCTHIQTIVYCGNEKTLQGCQGYPSKMREMNALLPFPRPLHPSSHSPISLLPFPSSALPSYSVPSRPSPTSMTPQIQLGDLGSIECYKMREIIFMRAEMRGLSENAWDSREMRETWQVCIIYIE